MTEPEIERLIVEAIPEAQIEIQINGNSFMLRVISDAFEGLRALKRQQLVYSCINDKIKSGEMHAVTMRLFTLEEWKQEQKFSL
jgi:acid stress-induced BolA-like protein IbaG/YrbA